MAQVVVKGWEVMLRVVMKSLAVRQCCRTLMTVRLSHKLTRLCTTVADLETENERDSTDQKPQEVDNLFVKVC